MVAHEKEIELLDGERIDKLIREDLKIIQDEKTFCFSIDAVLLAHFVTIKEKDKIIDLGTGCGVIPLILTSRKKNLTITGVEIQDAVANMAKRSVKLNDLEDKINIIHGDLKEAPELFETGHFDLVISNPPYMTSGSGFINEKDAVAIAKHELKCKLEDVISVASKLLNPKSRFAMVHRPERLTDIMNYLRCYKIEPKRLRLVQPNLGKKPTMILIEAVKDGQPGVDIMEPLYVYNKDGKYTEELLNFYYGK